MTSQVLMSNLVIERANTQAATSNASIALPATNRTALSSSAADSPHSVSAAPAQRLPYQANHQAELLCLQAEADALLQQLQVMKQEKLAAR